VVITATILLPEREAREHDRTAVSLWFSGRSSLHRISIMGVLSRYYHLFNQNFTGRRDTVDNLVFISCISFNFLINPAVNCGPLSEIMLSGSPCSHHTLSLNNLASPSAIVFSVVDTKCAIFVNQSTTTRMLSYP